MARPPLRLERYFFTRTLVEASDGFQIDDLKKIRPDQHTDMTLDIEFAKSEVNDKQYRITMAIHNLRSKELALPYKVEIKMVGWFTVDAEFTHPEIDRLVQVNGASMLFGAAREHVLSITARQLNGPYQLPTIDLASELPRD